MARNIYISVLGTGRYEECIYFKDGFSKSTKYIQEACLQYLNDNENKESVCLDKAFFLLTEKASQVHWPQLKDILCADGFSSVLEEVHIPDGKNESEVWDIFTKIYDIMEDGDNIYFDVTHAFRYLPMLVIAVGYYSVFLKNTNIKAVFYGNYDGRNVETKEAPIMDFLPIIQIQEWSFAAGSYFRTGSISQLTKLCRDNIVPLLRTQSEARKVAIGVKSFADGLDSVINDRRSCRGYSVFASNTVNAVLNQRSVLEQNLIPAYWPILDKVMYDVDKSRTLNDVNNLFKASSWCLNVGLYQQSITFAEEGLITKVCLDNGIDVLDVSGREKVSGAFSNAFQRNQPNYDSDSYTEEVRHLAEFIPQELAYIYNRISQLRNDINHCGFRGKAGDNNKPRQASEISSKIGGVLKDLNDIIGLDDETETVQYPNRKFFLNISNHPIDKWSKEQLNAAMEYADFKEDNMIEMGFPQIDPGWNEEKITDLAVEWLGKVKVLAPYPFNSTVHVMGEMNFTLCLVKELMSCGYKCVASTTKRNVNETDSGEKISRFEFVRFREYY